MVFLKPLRLLGLLLLSIIVVIHLKKRKVKEVLISSTFLWQQVFEDIKKVKKKRINKYFLLILHLLIGIFVIIIFSKPRLNLINNKETYTIVVDGSISMKAIENGNSHMDMLRKEVKDFIKSSPKNSNYNLVLMKNKTDILKENINKNELIKEIDNISPVNEPLDVEKAHNVINTFGGKIVIFTDKEIFKRKKVIKIGNGIEDLGIIYAASYNKNKGYYCIVKNYGKKNKVATITLKDDSDNLLGSCECNLNSNEEKKVNFNIVSKNIETIHFSIVERDMISENNYYLLNTLEKNKKRVVLIGENYFLEKALKVIPYVEIIKKDNIDTYNEKYDLYVICKDNIKNIPKKSNIWWVHPPKNIVTNKKIMGGLKINTNILLEKMDENEVYGEAYEIIDNDNEIEEIIKIDNKPVMGIDKKNNIYSSIEWSKCEIVLTPAFPILVENILRNFIFKDSENYNSNDFLINNFESKNNTKLFPSNLINVDLSKILAVVILIILVIEWQVFRNEY
ncbi:BatA domain-containing protein [Clostridium rectalis]|uniref:BatA domain-containing protein n=1 Tax=Clostridium rectalis TaxID=2040295 RepID=UPI000F62CDF4|nr:BatA domain-containing protein [Clostridium rectalis]